MIHPLTKLRWISEEKGYGVYATSDIPIGTITYVSDKLDIKIGPYSPLHRDEHYREIIQKYGFTDSQGINIISWDHAKFMNHCCDSNTLTTGWGFEIAIKNIRAGEEITDDYGVFTASHPMRMVCEQSHCRKKIAIDDFELHAKVWDEKIKNAFLYFNKADQPLKKYIPKIQLESLYRYLNVGGEYISVRTQKPPEF